MSTAAGALGGYLREQGFDTRDLRVRASVPVNLREAEEPLSLGNKFGLVFVELALGLANPLQRLQATHDAMATLKGSLQPAASLMSLGLMGMLPAAAAGPRSWRCSAARRRPSSRTCPARRRRSTCAGSA